MKPEMTAFRVSWCRSGHQVEIRTFSDADLAAEFYVGISRDPLTTQAKLVETIERELRFFERQQADGKPSINKKQTPASGCQSAAGVYAALRNPI